MLSPETPASPVLTVKDVEKTKVETKPPVAFAGSLPFVRPNLALHKLRRGELVHLYVLGNFATARHVDFVCQSGLFDALWFDVEHFDLPTQDLATFNLVARSSTLTTIARASLTDYQVTARLLEAGSGGLMASMINTVEQARSVVRWAKFQNPSPLKEEVTGERGWNGGGIDGRYGNFPALDYVRHQNNETMLIAQIETPVAVDNALAIARVPGIDGLFFGPGDYAHLLGVPSQLGHPQVLEAMERTAQAAADAGKWWGTVAPTRDLYQKALAWGARLLCPGGDTKTINLGIRELAKVFS